MGERVNPKTQNDQLYVGRSKPLGNEPFLFAFLNRSKPSCALKRFANGLHIVVLTWMAGMWEDARKAPETRAVR